MRPSTILSHAASGLPSALVISSSDARSLFAFAKRAWRIKSHKDAHGQIRRETHEPSVERVISRSGFPRQWFTDRLDPAARATLHGTLKHGDHLERASGLGDDAPGVWDIGRRLVGPEVGLAVGAEPVVVTEYGRSVAVLNTINQGRPDALAAIHQHGVGSRELQERRLSGT